MVINSQGVPVVMGRNCEIVLDDEQGRERARHRVPYGAQLLVDDGVKVTKGQKLAEWDPYTLPIITEREGIVNYIDLVEGVSMREVIDETTGISNRVVIDWKQQPRGNDLKPRITLRDEKGNVIILPNGLEARYFLSVDAILSVENGAPREGRRRAGAYPARRHQDPRHHRRSAARGRTVRGPQAEGLRDHQRDRRPRRVRQGLQDQAPHRRGAGGCRRGIARVSDPEGQAHLACRRATMSRRAIC